jgi:hypothetical protein
VYIDTGSSMPISPSKLRDYISFHAYESTSNILNLQVVTKGIYLEESAILKMWNPTCHIYNNAQK